MSSSIKPITPISSITSYSNQIHKSRPKKSSPLTTEVIFNEHERLPINSNHNHQFKINSNFQIFLTLIIDGFMFIFLSYNLLPRILNLNSILELNHQSLSKCLPFCRQHLAITSTLIHYTDQLTSNLHLQMAIIGFLVSFQLIYGLITLTSSSSISPLKYLLRTTGTYLTITAISGIHSQISQINPSLYTTILTISSATILLMILIVNLIIIFSSPILWFIHQIIEEEDRRSIIISTSINTKQPQSNLVSNLQMRWYPNQPASAISPHKRALIGPGF